MWALRRKGVNNLNDRATTIRYLSIELGKSDREIGEFLGVHRSTITHYRNNHNIPKPITVGRQGELAVISRLKKLGFKIEDLNLTNKASRFDLLVNENIKVEVKSSKINKNGYFNFTFTNKPENQCKISENVMRLKNGKTVKNYQKFADYFIFVGIENDFYHFWVIPTSSIKIGQQNLMLNNNSQIKFKDNFSLLERKE
ncbi:XRE family transcriptional regulator [Staphylococcus haemolyticus]|nr:XRE family transcriptional regulator [Staphylococcus haemolyticus]RFU03459.1 XRE family transcriptional regulator [Staphylococcus haemolyticus]